MANNWFGKKIILLNKKMIYLSANALSNGFLRKSVAINRIFFQKCQKAILRTIKTTLHNNYSSLVAKLLNVLLLVKDITEDSFFYK